VAIAADCKSAPLRVRWFESICRHKKVFDVLESILSCGVTAAHLVLVQIIEVRILAGQQRG
jgi:hypothetical protein